jgi:hypothetical protein
LKNGACPSYALKLELSPDTATGRLILFGLGNAKSADGKSDIKIADELPVATSAGSRGRWRCRPGGRSGLP